jgi:hypothetical protein
MVNRSGVIGVFAEHRGPTGGWPAHRGTRFESAIGRGSRQRIMMQKRTAVYGVVLGVAVFIWQVLSAALGAAAPWFIPIATGIECALLLVFFSGLEHGISWLRHAGAGAIVSALGAVLVFGGSLLVSQVLFPDLLSGMGSPPPTPLAAAGGGAAGTLVTGAALSVALALWQRKAGGAA